MKEKLRDYVISPLGVSNITYSKNLQDRAGGSVPILHLSCPMIDGLSMYLINSEQSHPLVFSEDKNWRPCVDKSCFIGTYLTAETAQAEDL